MKDKVWKYKKANIMRNIDKIDWEKVEEMKKKRKEQQKDKK